MAGISPINSISSTTSVFSSLLNNNNQRLTAITKAKLRALGINTWNIRTEAEGQQKLRSAQLSQTRQTPVYLNQGLGHTNYDKLLEKLNFLAKKLNISIGSSDTINDIIYKIKNAIAKLKVSVGEDKSKLALLSNCESRLSSIENMRRSEIDLGKSMDITGSQNRYFFGI